MELRSKVMQQVITKVSKFSQILCTNIYPNFARKLIKNPIAPIFSKQIWSHPTNDS